MDTNLAIGLSAVILVGAVFLSALDALARYFGLWSFSILRRIGLGIEIVASIPLVYLFWTS
jgi:hypothetical protein